MVAVKNISFRELIKLPTMYTDFDFFDFILEKPFFLRCDFLEKEIFARWFKFLVGGSCFVRNNWLDRNKTMAMEAEPDQTYEQPVVTAEPEIGAR